MCGRYSVLTEDEIIAIRGVLHDISMSLVRDELENYKIKSGKTEILPTDKAPIIAVNSDGASFESAKFGFKKWDGKGVIINARTDTLQKPNNMFSKIKSIGRCVVPANEYYEWQEQGNDIENKAKKKKIKHLIKDKDGNILFFAGLYQDTTNGREFVIITKDAYGDVADIHHRMPVILLAEQIELWLNSELTPEDISNLDFNAAVAPCKNDNDGEQLNLL